MLVNTFIYQISIPANENGLKWIKMDSDFQKYRFINVKINPFQSWMHFYSHIYRNCIVHISIPFNLKIILAFSVHIVNTQFKFVNRKYSFFNSVKFKNNISNFCAMSQLEMIMMTSISLSFLIVNTAQFNILNIKCNFSIIIE